MSEPCETNSRPLAASIEQQQHTKNFNTHAAPPSQDKRRKRSSTSSNGTIVESKSKSSRRHSKITNEPVSGPNTGSSHTAQRLGTSPNHASSAMSSVNYTKTGRVSKAKKGLKVHDCECGRSYTRAEHLRRHQRNHAQEGAMICKFPDCGKTFYRSDLLQRHEERHNEIVNTSRQPSVSSTEHSTHPSPVPFSASLPIDITGIQPSAVPYPPSQILSPQPEVMMFPRYNPSLFRTPQLHRTPKIALSNPSNHVFRSSPNFKSSPNHMKHHSSAPYLARHSISGPILADGGMTTSGVWHDSFAQSPYSCSSGYASPIPIPEYGHMYATPPYGPGAVRTRASSNASFIEPWTHPSQSPTSSVSNLQCSWPSEEKNAISSSFPYPNVSYPTISMPTYISLGTMAHYGHLGANEVVQMDHEEGAELFPPQVYGMSQAMHTYPFEQYLNNYWRLFHPTFPVVHRFTFASIESSPMLYAAMIALGAQYSNKICDKRKGRDINNLCVKLLKKREQSNLNQYNRLCDYQAIFLVEVFDQFRARRCAETLSPRFIAMYRKLAGLLDPITSAGLTSHTPTQKDDVQERWMQWTKLSAKQRLLLSCFVLESQQSTLLARGPQLPLIQISSDNLPFPAHRTLWDATDPQKWAIVAQQYSRIPRNVFEASNNPIVGCYDIFQCSILIAAHYNHFIGPAPYLDLSIDHLLDASLTTQHQLLTAKLAHLVPIRALLAVSGKSWVLYTKVTSQPEFVTLRSTLHAWVGQLWSEPADTIVRPTVEALRISIAILKLSLSAPEPPTLHMGDEMGLFLASLVVWAATVAAKTRAKASSLSSQQSGSLLESQQSANTMTQPTLEIYPAMQSTAPHATYQIPELYQDLKILPTPPTSSDRKSSTPHSKITSNTLRFLDSAIEDFGSLNVAVCHIGCTSLLLWVKMRVCGASLDERGPEPTYSNPSGDDYGGLVHAILDQIDGILDHGWEGWGI